MSLRHVARVRRSVLPRVEELEGRQLLSVALLPGHINARTVNHGLATEISSHSGIAARGQSPQVPFARDHLTIQTLTGAVPLSIEIASTPAQRRHGLMHRETLPPDEGMLFILPRDQPVAMWMKDTVLPLDMLFIDRHGRIVYIARETRPFSTRIISARRPVRAVLEILGGTAALRGIGVGDQVIHPYFTP
jgi:uncharacterized membrane protein (UPF0127 family)